VLVRQWPERCSRQLPSKELGATLPHIGLPLPGEFPDPAEVAGGPHLNGLLSLGVLNGHGLHSTGSCHTCGPLQTQSRAPASQDHIVHSTPQLA
jgi:hypothetical protein